MKTGQIIQRQFDEVTLSMTLSSSYDPVSSESMSYSGSFDPDKSIASRRDSTRSHQSHQGTRPSMFSEPTDAMVTYTYHHIDRPTAQPSSKENLDDGRRNNFFHTRRSVTPTPRSEPPKSLATRSLAPRSLTPHICDRLYSMGVHMERVKAKQKRIREKNQEKETKSDDMARHCGTFDTLKSVASTSETTQSSRSYKSSNIYTAGTFDTQRSVASTSDATQSSRSYESSQTYPAVEHVYNPIDRPVRCEDPTAQLSSRGSSDYGKRNDFLRSKGRLNTPPRSVSQRVVASNRSTIKCEDPTAQFFSRGSFDYDQRRSATPTPRRGTPRCEDPTAQFSSRGSFGYDQRNGMHPSRRSATPTPRRVTPRMVAPRSLTPHICERLYSMGIRTQIVKAKQERMKKKDPRVQNAPLQINRSYTPKKLRPYEHPKTEGKKCPSVHEYLFNTGIKQIDKERALTMEDTSKEQKRAQKVLSSEEKDKIISRLYARSKLQQNDGKERRMNIARALTPKPRPPQKTITLSKATALYKRLMAQKESKDKKIEIAQNIRLYECQEI